MGRRIAFVMNGHSDGTLRFGRNDVDRVFGLLTDREFGECDPGKSGRLYDCQSATMFTDAFVVKLLNTWDRKDQLLFYFSGHGIMQGGVFTLQMGPLLSDRMPFDHIMVNLRQYGVQRAIVVLDACHSGCAIGEKSTADSVIEGYLENLPEGRALIVSCAPHQQSHEHEPDALSVFTTLLGRGIESGLGGRGTDRGVITPDDAVVYIKEQLRSEEFEAYPQFPRYSVQDADDRLWIARNRSSSQASPDGDVLEGVFEIHWGQLMLRLPIDAEVLGEGRTLVEGIRTRARDFLSKAVGGASFSDSEVRANVFLPDYRKPKPGTAFRLVMTPELRCKMEHQPEWELQFQPGQGATGTAFEEGKTLITLRRSTDEGDWDARFQLTNVHRERIHERLRWIVSIPLKDPSTGATLAVLNIDGLQAPPDQDIIDRLLVHLTFELTALAGLLSEQPKVQTIIGWSDENV